jgi:hypothetical protein
MSASALLANLEGRGVKVWADGDRIKMRAADGVITDADRDQVKAIKAELLALLNRPRLGTLRCPIPIRKRSRPTNCPWDDCGGLLSNHSNLYWCTKCESWFELLPPPEGEWEGIL